MQILSDGMYIAYFILVLFAVKYKKKYLMFLSIGILILSAASRILVCVTICLDADKPNYYEITQVIFVLLNSIVPWRFLTLWN